MSGFTNSLKRLESLLDTTLASSVAAASSADATITALRQGTSLYSYSILTQTNGNVDYKVIVNEISEIPAYLIYQFGTLPGVALSLGLEVFICAAGSLILYKLSDYVSKKCADSQVSPIVKRLPVYAFLTMTTINRLRGFSSWL